MIGKNYYREGDYDNALFQFDRALEKDETNALGYLLRGKANHKKGNIKEAITDYNNAIRINKELGDAYISRGALHIYLKRYSTACADFKMANSLEVETAEDLLKKYCK